jgi:hypothetical protein
MVRIDKELVEMGARGGDKARDSPIAFGNQPPVPVGGLAGAPFAHLVFAVGPVHERMVIRQARRWTRAMAGRRFPAGCDN